MWKTKHDLTQVVRNILGVSLSIVYQSPKILVLFKIVNSMKYPRDVFYLTFVAWVSVTQHLTLTFVRLHRTVYINFDYDVALCSVSLKLDHFLT